LYVKREAGSRGKEEEGGEEEGEERKEKEGYSFVESTFVLRSTQSRAG
jgi:hypothetical protein